MTTPDPIQEQCGYCGGCGYVHGSMYDRDGRKNHDEPPRRTCEYCCGYGTVEDGHKLLPAESREEIIRRQQD